MRPSPLRASAIGLLGLACVVIALRLLDAPFDREVIAWFVVLPIGAILVTISLWHLLATFFTGD